MFEWLFGRKKKNRQSEGKSAQPPYGASISPYVVPRQTRTPYASHTPVSGYAPNRSRTATDDDSSLTGSAITDGLLGIPSSPTALVVDIATHDFGSSSSSFDSGSSSSSFDSGASSSFDSGSSGGGDSGGGGSGW